MLAALAAIREGGCLTRLHCIHVEHGIRPEAESRGDGEFVKSLCRQFKIPCRVVHIPQGKIAETAGKQGIGIEAAARLYRRRVWHHEIIRLETLYTKTGLTGTGNRIVRILTAHTADDMLETVLMRILRGSGPSGLAAMPQSRGRILRPLLGLNRSDVLAYLGEKKIPWREDSTNSDIVFFRNRIRHCLIPLLAGEFPRWRKALSSFAQTQSLAADFIGAEANRQVIWKAENKEKALSTDADYFFSRPVIIREEALFQGIDKLFSAACVHGLTSTVRRKNIRRFCEKKINSADLGRLKLVKDSCQVTLILKQDSASCSESGFSLLINTAGLYNLMGINIDVSVFSAEEKKPDVFYASLPLVFHPCLKSDRIEQCRADKRYFVTAADTKGNAAFIGREGLIYCRDEEAPESVSGKGTGVSVKITVESSNGGIDA